MKTQKMLSPSVLTVAMFIAQVGSAAPWIYRGNLSDGGREATGAYDLRISLVGANDALLTSPVTLYGVSVQKGRFQTDVDFGLDVARFPGAKIITEVQQGGSGFVRLGDAMAVPNPQAPNGGAVCWNTDGNTGLNGGTVGIPSATGNDLLVVRSGTSNLYLRASGGVEQDGSTAQGDNAAAWNGSTAAGGGSFTVGRGQTGSSGANSFAYSDVPVAPGSGVAGYSNAPGEFLIRSAGGIAMNSVPGNDDLSVGPRPGGDASTGIGLKTVVNNRYSFIAMDDVSGNLNVVVPSETSASGRVGIYSAYGASINSGLTSSVADLILGASAGGDADTDFRLQTRNNKQATFYLRDSDGGLRLIADNLSGTQFLVTNANGAFLSSGGVWTNGSSRTFKKNFASINPLEILSKVVALPVSSWTYNNSDEGLHVGPMAEDFKAAFGLGSDEKHIGTVDADGVALAAIQGLNLKLTAAEAENAALKARLDALEARIEK
jgi:hypothetical protein